MIKLGHIDYLNCLPLTYIMQQGLPDGVEVDARVPAELNRMIMTGELDISPVSSIIYARNYKELEILPEVSITTNGEVQSIIFVTKKPWEKLKGGKVLLTAQSATSHCLCKILAKKKYKVEPHYEIAAIGPGDDYLAEADGALFIGDNALYINNHREEGLYYYDLGKIWQEFTGHPMVYALWVVPKMMAANKGDLLRPVHQFVRDGFIKGFAQLSDAIKNSDKLSKFSYDILWEYLHVIKWQLTDKELAGLKLFYTYAYELGLVEEIPTLNFGKL